MRRTLNRSAHVRALLAEYNADLGVWMVGELPGDLVVWMAGKLVCSRSAAKRAIYQATRNDPPNQPQPKRTDIKADLVRALRDVIRALEEHIKDQAAAAKVEPARFCPCTETEIAQARAVLARIDAGE